MTSVASPHGVIVGSIALDSIETPFGSAEETLGGAAVYASLAASLLCPATNDCRLPTADCGGAGIGIVGVVGGDFPQEHLDLLAARGVNLEGVQRVSEGESFHWSGRYVGDMGGAETLETRLGVFGDFAPQLPLAYRGADVLFLANIQPSLQLSVLEQTVGGNNGSQPFVLCDTMNFWIEGAREELLEVLRRVDLVLLNDAEVRQLTGLHGIAAGVERMLEWGPQHVVVKRGEHGVSLTSGIRRQASGVRDGRETAREREGGLTHCFVPAYPTQAVRDPTGAGDTFAGGVMGYLCRVGKINETALRRAMICGTALASIAVESLGVGALAKATLDDVRARAAALTGMSVEPLEL